jgi:hypothetical protein
MWDIIDRQTADCYSTLLVVASRRRLPQVQVPFTQAFFVKLFNVLRKKPLSKHYCKCAHALPCPHGTFCGRVVSARVLVGCCCCGHLLAPPWSQQGRRRLRSSLCQRRICLLSSLGISLKPRGIKLGEAEKGKRRREGGGGSSFDNAVI